MTAAENQAVLSTPKRFKSACRSCFQYLVDDFDFVEQEAAPEFFEVRYANDNLLINVKSRSWGEVLRLDFTTHEHLIEVCAHWKGAPEEELSELSKALRLDDPAQLANFLELKGREAALIDIEQLLAIRAQRDSLLSEDKNKYGFREQIRMSLQEKLERYASGLREHGSDLLQGDMKIWPELLRRQEATTEEAAKQLAEQMTQMGYTAVRVRGEAVMWVPPTPEPLLRGGVFGWAGIVLLLSLIILRFCG